LHPSQNLLPAETPYQKETETSVHTSGIATVKGQLHVNSMDGILFDPPGKTS